MRIQKYFSEQKILSRRETEDFILKGFITVNGKVVKELGTQIDPTKDKVEIIEAAKPTLGKKITIAFHKPRGIVVSKIKEEGPTIFDLLPQFTYLNAVGRLDKESEGLILLSNDGAVTATVTGTEHLVEKEYEVEVSEPVNAGKLRKMEEGIMLVDGKTLPAKTYRLSPTSFHIVLREGRKHQIRRMCAALRLTIIRLKRIRIGTILLKGIDSGKYRELTEKEVASLKKGSPVK
ncbi:MAG: pseudouridine synthase [Candidatus Paceibacterota bacterium]|jgi:pseudouridine synthase